jgi:large subunit ribosomal protein L22
MVAEDTNTFTASHRFARISPHKARLVMDLIRGKPVEDALTTLRFCQRRASPMIRQVVRSAMANATQKAGVESEELVVWKAFVDDGPREGRFRHRAMGRVYPRIRRKCHLSVVLRQRPKEESAAKTTAGGPKKAAGGPKEAEE